VAAGSVREGIASGTIIQTAKVIDSVPHLGGARTADPEKVFGSTWGFLIQIKLDFDLGET
jgi:hypothetical protein